MKTIILSYLVVLLLASPILRAQSSVVNQLEKCRTEQDTSKRLTCYDEIIPQNDGSLTQKATELGHQVVSAEQTADNFGKENRQVTNNHVDQIYATVSKVSSNARKQLIIELDNGQIWQQRDSERYPLQTGEQIYIKRGALGAFYLGKDSINRTLRVVRSN